METAIGVFASREHAAEAFRELLAARVPRESIVFLTRSEAEVKTVEHEVKSAVGGLVGISAGIAIALLAVPGVGPVFSLGFGAAASSLFGMIGTGVGAAMQHSAPEHAAPGQAASPETSGDAAFFQNVLKEGRSLIVVRTESRDTASAASRILDRFGLKIKGPTQPQMQAVKRQSGDVTIVKLSGRITLGEGNLMLREIVRDAMESGSRKILLNVHEIGYIDSSGIGELVRTYTTLKNQGGQLILLNPGKRLTDLLQMTRLISVFEIENDEAAALQSLSRPNASPATA